MHFQDATGRTIETLLSDLQTTRSGLSEHVAKLRNETYGTNALQGQRTHWWDILLRQFSSPFLYLLLLASVVSFFLRETTDALMILLFVCINTTLGFYQEYHSEKILALLKQFILTKATVLRDGTEAMIDAARLVPGDIVLLKPGDIIPCDIRFLDVQNCRVDESALTGEAAAVEKQSIELAQPTKEIYKAINIGFSGTNVVSGKGVGVVIATGNDTAIGEIAKLTSTTSHQSSFEKEIAQLSVFILKLISLTLVAIVIINIFLKGPTTNVFTLVVFAIALAISVIPEALPVVTTFCLSRGALHLAKNKVVVKRLSSIEDLGSIEVLCTDKTGTLTENKLTVADIFPEKQPEYLTHADLSIPMGEKSDVFADPFDAAIKNFLTEEQAMTTTAYKKIAEVLFTPERRKNSVLVKKGKTYTLIVRGAQEALLPLCKTLSSQEKISLTKWITKEGKDGKRVIALATKHLTKLPKDIEKEEHALTFLCCVSFEDPLKKTADEAILKAEKLGVQIKILTGDSREVAGAVAYKTGLIKDENQVMTGDEFDDLSRIAKHDAVDHFAVFARTSPVQKHMIVTLLQEKYEVGFLGEGINDAPALKTANVAIVVQSASGIAREAADIVLLHKSLNVVVDGIHEGREIFGNTAKYIKTTLASNFGNFYTIATVSIFIPFLPLLPLQILLINLLTDFPMIAVATDTNDEGALRRPKSYDVKEIAIFATVMGIVSTLFDFLFFAVFVRISPEVLQTNWFIGSVLTELLFIFAIRTRLPVWRAKPPSLPLVALTLLAFVTAIILPFTGIGSSIFSFVAPQPNYLLLTFCITGAYFIATEATKLLYYKFIEPDNNKKEIREDSLYTHLSRRPRTL